MSKVPEICENTFLQYLGKLCSVSFQWFSWEARNTQMRMPLMLSSRNMVAVTMLQLTVKEYVAFIVTSTEYIYSIYIYIYCKITQRVRLSFLFLSTEADFQIQNNLIYFMS